MTPVTVKSGSGPIILGQPHCGTFVPAEIEVNLNERGRQLSDTDWHVDRLYEDLIDDASVVRANFHRYVIDANRGPDGKMLYKNNNTTGLVPLTDFDGEPIWSTPPDEDAIAYRLRNYHSPYHQALVAEISRVKGQHGFAILFDCHSIRSHIPYLFDGVLPDLNIGTNEGKSCARLISDAVIDVCRAQATFSHVLDDRFKGGWTTRHYGQPNAGVHAIQLELAQSLYLTEEKVPFTYSDQKAGALRSTLKRILSAVSAAATQLQDQE